MQSVDSSYIASYFEKQLFSYNHATVASIGLVVHLAEQSRTSSYLLAVLHNYTLENSYSLVD